MMRPNGGDGREGRPTMPLRRLPAIKFAVITGDPTHPAPFDMISSILACTYKTVADAFSGFHQIDLNEPSRHLTTFLTQWGRYQYCRTLMEHCSASKAYSKRFDDNIEGVKRNVK